MFATSVFYSNECQKKLKPCTVGTPKNVLQTRHKSGWRLMGGFKLILIPFFKPPNDHSKYFQGKIYWSLTPASPDNDQLLASFLISSTLHGLSHGLLPSVDVWKHKLKTTEWFLVWPLKPTLNLCVLLGWNISTLI